MAGCPERNGLTSLPAVLVHSLGANRNRRERRYNIPAKIASLFAGRLEPLALGAFKPTLSECIADFAPESGPRQDTHGLFALTAGIDRNVDDQFTKTAIPHARHGWQATLECEAGSGMRLCPMVITAFRPNRFCSSPAFIAVIIILLNIAPCLLACTPRKRYRRLGHPSASSPWCRRFTADV